MNLQYKTFENICHVQINNTNIGKSWKKKKISLRCAFAQMPWLN